MRTLALAAIGCFLVMIPALTEVTPELRGRLRQWRVAGPWLDGENARIDSFFVQREGAGLALRDTLMMSDRLRIGIEIRLTRRGQRWRVDSVHSVVDHAVR